MNHLVYLDTEFTDLLYPELLSVGLVTHDAAEHYVELDMSSANGVALQHKASTMVVENVLSQWGRVSGASCTREEMGKRMPPNSHTTPSAPSKGCERSRPPICAAS